MARAGDSGRAGVRRPTGPARGTGRTRGAAGSARAAAETARAELRRRLEPRLAEAGFDLEDVTVARAGTRSVVRIAVDRDGGIDLDAVADASRLVSAVLDEAEEAGGGPLAGPYVLEVSSPGVDRPLTEPRHWRRAVGRLVLVRHADGTEVEGRVLSADDEGADLSIPTGVVRRGRPPRTRLERVVYGSVARAVIQIEFGADTTDPEPDGPEDADLALDGADGTDTDVLAADVLAADVLAADVSDQDAEVVADGDGDAVGGPDEPAEPGEPGGATEDHGAVGAEADRSGRNGKEMNR